MFSCKEFDLGDWDILFVVYCWHVLEPVCLAEIHLRNQILQMCHGFIGVITLAGLHAERPQHVHNIPQMWTWEKSFNAVLTCVNMFQLITQGTLNILVLQLSDFLLFSCLPAGWVFPIRVSIIWRIRTNKSSERWQKMEEGYLRYLQTRTPLMIIRRNTETAGITWEEQAWGCGLGLEYRKHQKGKIVELRQVGNLQRSYQIPRFVLANG